ncbi:MAG: nitroreductase family protein [Lachnospiraceae bacterium]|nr:nitroreductase family protein [Lachnospiraceae bacterium]
MSELRELVLKNRSYRGYDRSRKITKEELLELVDLARICPSSKNGQALKFHIAYEEEEVARIQPTTMWAGALPELHLPYPGTEPVAFIVICIDTQLAPNEAVFVRDVGITAQTMLLGAAEKGLGGCMIGSFKRADLIEAIGLPEHLSPNLVIALGKPAEEIILTQVPENGSTNYYRDEAGIHYVPKRSLEDLLV